MTRDPLLPSALAALVPFLFFALFACPAAAAQKGGREATVADPEEPARRYELLSPAGQQHMFWDGDPKTEDAKRVLALAGGATIRYDDVEVIAQNILVWLAPDSGLESTGVEFPFGVSMPAPTPTPENAPFASISDPEDMADPIEVGDVLEIYAEGDVYVAQGSRRVFQAERVYINVLENRSLVVRGEIRSDLAATSGIDLASLRKAPASGSAQNPKANTPPVPIVIRAAEIRGVSDGLFTADNAQFTTSTFAKPGYHIAMNHMVYEELSQEQGGRVTGTGNRFVLGDVSLLHLQHFTVRTGVESPFPLINFSAGANSRFGVYTETRWGSAFQDAGDSFNHTIGVDGDFTGQWFADVNLYSSRGLGLGGGIEYETKVDDQLAYFGSTQFFWIYDHKREDETGTDQKHKGNRGRFKTENRVFLGDGWQFDTEVNYLSDENFLREFMEEEFRTTKEAETYAYLKKVEGDAAVTALAKFQLNHWQTQTEYLPQVTYDIISRPVAEAPGLGSLFRDPSEPARVYWTHRSEAGVVQRQIGNTGKKQRDGDNAFRVDDIERLNLPFDAGIVRVDPFFENRLTVWLGDGKKDGDSDVRAGMGIGFNASTQFWKTMPDIESTRWNIRGLRHLIEPTLRYRWNFMSTTGSDRLVKYDSVERYDVLHTLVPGVRNRFETKRMTPFGIQSVTFLDIDVQQAFVFQNDRASTDTIGDLFIETTYRPDLERFLLRNARVTMRTDLNWDDSSLDRFNFEFATEPGPDLFASIAYAYAKRGRTSPTLALEGFTPSKKKNNLNQLTLQLARQVSRLWDIALVQQFDFDDQAWTESLLVLRRHTADWVFEFSVGAPMIGSGSGVGLSVSPAAFFRRDERRRFKTALSDGYDLTPIFDEPSYAVSPSLSAAAQ